MFFNRREQVPEPTDSTAAAAARQREHSQERARLHAAFEAHVAAIEAEVADLQAAATSAESRGRALQQQAQAAFAEYFQLRTRITDLRQAGDRHRHDLEAALRTVQDPRINHFLDELDRRQDDTRRGIVGRIGWGPRDPRTGRRAEVRGTNLGEVHYVVRAIIAARQRAQALVYSNVTDLDAALEDIRRSIPRLEDVHESDLQPAS